MRKQKGSGLILMLLLLALAIAGLLLVLKLFPLYFQHYQAGQVFQTMQEQHSQAGVEESLSVTELRDEVEAKFDGKQLNHLYPHVLIRDYGLEKRLSMEYERRVELTSNIDIIVTFEHNIEFSE